MNHTAHSPRSSGSTGQGALVPACRHRRYLRRSAEPRPAITTGATRRWDGEHRDAPRVRNSRHHITTSYRQRPASRDVTRLNEGVGEERAGDNSSHSFTKTSFSLAQSSQRPLASSAPVRTLARPSSVIARGRASRLFPR